MEKVFRTRSETANRVYRYFRTGPYNFPILLGFDALRLRISFQGLSCTNIQLLEMLNKIFTFEIFEFSSDGSSVDHRWPPVGKPPRKLIFPQRWSLVVHRWPPMDFPGLSVRAVSHLLLPSFSALLMIRNENAQGNIVNLPNTIEWPENKAGVVFVVYSDADDTFTVAAPTGATCNLVPDGCNTPTSACTRK